MDRYLGLDLGGTKLLAGEMTQTGRVLWTKRYDTGVLTQRNAFSLMRRAMDDIRSTRGLEGITGLGIGMPGKVDHASGVWCELDTVRRDPIALSEEMEALYGLRCSIDNDVRCAARAEWAFGMGRRARSLALLNIGTGIAAAYISEGRLLTGAHFEAGEIGHTSSGIVERRACFCGRDDCVENVAAGVGLDERARRLAKDHPGTALRLPPAPARVRATDIFALSDTDPLCALLTEDAARAAAGLIMNAVRFYDPECVVLAGGVISDPFFFGRVMDRIPADYRGYVPLGIRLSGLQAGCAGLMGACCCAAMALGRPLSPEEAAAD